jgi:hypothetical protein
MYHKKPVGKHNIAIPNVLSQRKKPHSCHKGSSGGIKPRFITISSDKTLCVRHEVGCRTDGD